jgi:hypothetical protein
MWTDGFYACILKDADGNPVAQVVKDGGGTWAAFDLARINSTGTGPLRVAGGFASSDAAKAYVNESIADKEWGT